MRSDLAVPQGGTGTSFQPGYSTSTNRFTSIPGITPTYDSNGNLTYDGHSYAWDAEGRPVTSASVSLTYDALGRMVEQNRSGARKAQYVLPQFGHEQSWSSVT